MFFLWPKDQVLMLERRDVVLIIGKITICKAIHHEAVSHLHAFLQRMVNSYISISSSPSGSNTTYSYTL